MVRKATPTLALLLGIALGREGAAQPPHLSGRVTLDPSRGAMGGSVCLTRFTPRRQVRFLLGNPLNIAVVTDTTGTPIPYDGEYGGRIVGEAREYVVTRPDTLPPLTALCVRYAGAVPTFDSAVALTDWKGRITSVGGNLRAAEQTRWYPTLFDSATGVTEAELTYDLRLHCTTCRTMYLNGADPVADTGGRFVSRLPRSLLIYAGAFPVRQDAQVTFIDGSASPSTAAAFSRAIARVGNYYATLLDVPYGDHPVLLSFESISRSYPHGRVSWQFVTWPTITFSGGLDFDALVVSTGGAPDLPDWLWGSLSHEMGHYYFGTLRIPHGPLYWFVLESTAEYLALKSIAALRDSVSAAIRMLAASNMGDASFTPLSAVTSREEIGTAYRYQLAPLELVLLEWRVGSANVARFLRALLNAPPDRPADYEAVARAAQSAGIARATFDSAFSLPPAAIRSAILARSREILGHAARTDPPTDVVRLAANLVNADTSLANRTEIMRALRMIVARTPRALEAHYQIGKIGAVAGIELGAAERSLRYYLRFPAGTQAPSHADANWRLGMVLERRHRPKAASDAYREALRLVPGHAGATESLRRLAAQSNPGP